MQDGLDPHVVHHWLEVGARHLSPNLDIKAEFFGLVEIPRHFQARLHNMGQQQHQQETLKTGIIAVNTRSADGAYLVSRAKACLGHLAWQVGN